MEIHIILFVCGIVMSVFFAFLGFMARNSKAGLFTIIGGTIMFSMVAMTEAHIFGYTEERSIITNSIYLTGQEASSFIQSHMNVTSGSGTRILTNNAGTRFSGEEITASSSLVGDTFNTVKVRLSKTGSPSGNAVLGVYSSSGTPSAGNYLKLISTIDASSLTTTPTDYEYTIDGYTLGSGQAVGIFYNSGSTGNGIVVSVATSDAFDGTNSRETIFTTVFGDNTTFDLMMALSFVVETQAEDSQTINSYDTVGNNPIVQPFTEEVKLLFGIIGVTFMLLGAYIMRKGED